MRDGPPHSRTILATGVALLLAGCGDDAPEPTREVDPATTAALADQIMFDPDLVGQNRADSAAFIPSGDGALPTLDGGAEAIAAARAEALRMVGGAGNMRKAPAPREVAGELPEGSALTAAARAATAPGTGPGCDKRVRYTMQWAARLPAAFPVYPRAAVQEAAGTDAAGCSLRAINFVTPVPLGEVIDFYYSRAEAAGFSAQRVLHGGDDTLGGVKGDASYVVYARQLSSGQTEVDLITSGG